MVNNIKLNGKKQKHREPGLKQTIIFCSVILAFPLAHFFIFEAFGNIEGLLLIFKTYDYENMEYVWLWEKGYSVFYNFSQGIKLYFGSGIEGRASAGGYLFTSFLYYLVSLPCMLTSYMCAYVVFKKYKSTGVIYFIRFIPIMLSSMVMVQLVNALLGETAHTLYAFNFGRLEPGSKEVYDRYAQWTNENMGLLMNEKTALPTLLFYMFLNGFIGDLAYLTGLMGQTSKDLMEYGKIDGLNSWGEFIHICLPVVWPFFSLSLYGILVGWISASGPIYELYGSGADRNVPESVKSLSYYITVNTLHSSQDGNQQTFFCFSTAMSVLIGYSKLPIVFITTKLVNLFDPMREKKLKKAKNYAY